MKVQETSTALILWLAVLILRWLCYLAYEFLKNKYKMGKICIFPGLFIFIEMKRIFDTSLTYRGQTKDRNEMLSSFLYNQKLRLEWHKKINL